MRVLLPVEYSASPCEALTDTGNFFKTSFGRIFCSVKNSGLPGFRPFNPLRKNRPVNPQAVVRPVFPKDEHNPNDRHINHRFPQILN
jgi:hypothetical protein